MKNVYLHNRNVRFRLKNLKNGNNITLLSIILSKILVKKKKKKKKHVKILIKRFFNRKKNMILIKEKRIEILNHYFNHYKNQYEIYLSCDL